MMKKSSGKELVISTNGLAPTFAKQIEQQGFTLVHDGGKLEELQEHRQALTMLYIHGYLPAKVYVTAQQKIIKAVVSLDLRVAS